MAARFTAAHYRRDAVAFAAGRHYAPGMSPLTSAVAAVIEDSVGRLLLCQQRQGHRLWGLPGGKIRLGESPIHAVVRDTREETGLEIEVVDLVGLYELTGDGCGEHLPDVLVYAFRARATGGEAVVNSPGRVGRVSWWEPRVFPSPLTATTTVALGDACAGRSGIIRKVTRAMEPELPEAVEERAG